MIQGMRVGDIATLRRSDIRDGELIRHTLKTGQPVRFALNRALREALECLPTPRGAEQSEYFFWTGEGTKRARVRGVTRTLARVFKLAGVPGAHAHRFRHTLATEILQEGGTAEDVATILGNSPAIVRKHYALWTDKRQERITSLLQTVF